jgi:multicomponent Na+:H+ antiporter subunit F
MDAHAVAAARWAVPALTALALLATLIATVRIVRGPRHADRVVALDIFLASAVALCVAASLGTGRTVFLDVAIGLALVGFVGTVGWARLIERSTLDGATREPDGGP